MDCPVNFRLKAAFFLSLGALSAESVRLSTGNRPHKLEARDGFSMESGLFSVTEFVVKVNIDCFPA